MMTPTMQRCRSARCVGASLVLVISIAVMLLYSSIHPWGSDSTLRKEGSEGWLGRDNPCTTEYRVGPFWDGAVTHSSQLSQSYTWCHKTPAKWWKRTPLPRLTPSPLVAAARLLGQQRALFAGLPAGYGLRSLAERVQRHGGQAAADLAQGIAMSTTLMQTWVWELVGNATHQGALLGDERYAGGPAAASSAESQPPPDAAFVQAATTIFRHLRRVMLNQMHFGGCSQVARDNSFDNAVAKPGAPASEVPPLPVGAAPLAADLLQASVPDIDLAGVMRASSRTVGALYHPPGHDAEDARSPALLRLSAASRAALQVYAENNNQCPTSFDDTPERVRARAPVMAGFGLCGWVWDPEFAMLAWSRLVHGVGNCESHAYTTALVYQALCTAWNATSSRLACRAVVEDDGGSGHTYAIIYVLLDGRERRYVADPWGCCLPFFLRDVGPQGQLLPVGSTAAARGSDLLNRPRPAQVVAELEEWPARGHGQFSAPCEQRRKGKCVQFEIHDPPNLPPGLPGTTGQPLAEWRQALNDLGQIGPGGSNPVTHVSCCKNLIIAAVKSDAGLYESSVADCYMCSRLLQLNGYTNQAALGYRLILTAGSQLPTLHLDRVANRLGWVWVGARAFAWRLAPEQYRNRDDVPYDSMSCWADLQKRPREERQQEPQEEQEEEQQGHDDDGGVNQRELV